MNKKLIISAAFLVLTSAAWAQQKSPRPTTVYIPQTIYQSPDINYQYHDGTAVLRDGSLLKGRFEYNGGSTFTYRSSVQTPRQRIGLSMVRRMALAGSDTLVTDRRDSTIFVRMGTRLYRQLAGGPTMILDRVFSVNEDRGKIGRKLYVFDANENWRSFTSLDKLNKWFAGLVEQSGKTLPDIYRNENEIVKAVVQLNGQ